MKRILITILALICISSSTAQVRQDLTIYRGDKTTVTFRSLIGDYSARYFRFAVKQNNEITGNRLIYKTTADGITATYSSATNSTVVRLLLDRSDTWDLRPITYVYDLESRSTTDTNDVNTILAGSFVVRGDVLTPFDGTDLPSTAIRYFPVLASSFDDGEFIKKSGTSFVGDSLLAYFKKADTTLTLATKYYLSQNYRTAAAQDAITGTKLDTTLASTLLRSQWSTAYSLSHSHLNKSILDQIDVAFTSSLKSTYDGYNSLISGKEPTITAGTTAQYWRGDKTWQTLNKAAVDLSNVDNTSDATKNSATATLTNKTLSAPIITGATNITDAIFNRAVHSKGDEGGYLLDGVDDYDVHVFTQKNVGFEIWIFPTVTNKAILNFGTNMGVTFNSSNVVTYGASFANTSTFINGQPGTTLTLNQWNYLQCFYDEITPTTLEIGRVSTTYFTGKIAAFKVWNRALTTAEKIACYNSGSPTEYSMPFSDRGASSSQLTNITSKPTGWETSSGNNLIATSPIIQFQRASFGQVFGGKIYKITINVSSISGSFTIAGQTGFSHSNISGDRNITTTGTKTVIFTLTGLRQGTLDVYPNTANNTINFTVEDFISLGNVLDLQHSRAGQLGWIDNSGNRLHGQTSGSPICLTVGNKHLPDIKTAITGNTTLTNVIPKEYRIRGILVNNTTANAVTISIGTSSGGTQVVNAKACGAELTFINDAEILAKIFSLTADQTLFVHSANWNSSSINVEFSLSKY